jgi:glycosyltransferase involved in cell wall biosynthesis
MRISAIIPAYNSEKFIGQALDSIYRQTFPVYEVICIDDASTDKTVAYLEEHYPKVRIVVNPTNRGPAYSRNVGISLATGDVLAFLDSDDFWMPGKTRAQSDLLQAETGVEMIGGLTDHFSNTDYEGRVEAELIGKPHFNAYLSVFLIRKRVFDKIGILDNSMRHSEDQDWFFRVRESGIQIKILDQTVLMKRIHDGNMTKNMDFKDIGMVHAIKNSLNRRRIAGALRPLAPIHVDKPAGVSVIIPAFNAGKFLDETLNSVFGQTYQPLEVIVIDDGSTDDTANVVERFPLVRYFHQQNQGTSAALNTGLKLARGELFAFLDADDRWMPDKLEKQMNVIRQDNSIDMIFTGIRNFLCSGISPTRRQEIEYDPRPRVGIQKSTLLIRREAFFKVGLFSLTSGIELLDWYARAKEACIKEHIIHEVLVERRIHGSNQSILNKQLRKEFPRVIKTILDRRRRP